MNDQNNVVATTTRYRVEGMDCAACAAKIETAVGRLPGVQRVEVSVNAGTVKVTHGPEMDQSEISRQIVGLGYQVADHEEASRTDGHHGEAIERHEKASGNRSWWNTGKGRLTLACGLALSGAFVLGKLLPATERWAFLAAMAVGLVPIARRAFTAARYGTPFSIEMLMTIAAVGAVFIGAVEEAATVVFLFLIGELLEGVAASRARASIQDLTKLVPKTARLEENDQVREVPADSLEVGMTIQIRPGDRVPADGVILSGESAIDEAPVTGESTPIRKGPEASVFAGTVNGDGLLHVRVTAAAADNTIARVVRLVEEAQESKAPTERFIDRLSRFYTPSVVAVAALVAVVPPLLSSGEWSSWIYKGLAILLIGCPCALVISTPAAIAASLSAGARRGLLLKGGAVLEGIGKITVACFDKTGTLTAGKPQVTDIVGFDRSEAEVLRFAAALESGSSHPLASAILAKAAEQKKILPPPTSDANAIGGKGIRATVEGADVFLGSPKAVAELCALTTEQNASVSAMNDEGKTVSLVAVDGKIAGAIAVRDEPRPDAKRGLKLLTDAGIRTVMLTGDNRRTADAIGKQLGIDVEAELLPEDKQRIVGRFQKAGWSVAKIGDGINDAPALAAADVGIAMGGGTDVALETADAAVLHGRVADVAAMVDLSKRTMINIRQNIAVALGLKAIFLVTTVVGLTGLWPAILADTGATVLVTLNALRLLAPPRA